MAHVESLSEIFNGFRKQNLEIFRFCWYWKFIIHRHHLHKWFHFACWCNFSLLGPHVIYYSQKKARDNGINHTIINFQFSMFDNWYKVSCLQDTCDEAISPENHFQNRESSPPRHHNKVRGMPRYRMTGDTHMMIGDTRWRYRTQGPR